MWPSTWAAAGPSAMCRTVQVVAEQLMTMVWSPPSLVTTSSPACIPALVSSAPGRRRMLLVPGWRLPGERRSATYAAQLRLKPAGTEGAASPPEAAACRHRCPGEEPGLPAGTDRPDPPGRLVGGNQVAAEGAERQW